MGDEACEFCQIATGERDAYTLFEDQRTVAFLDRNPAIRGHTLVIPKPHEKFLFTADESLATAVFRTVRRIALAMDDTLEPDGVSLFYTSAELVGHIDHVHVHLLPRYTEDAIHIALPRVPLDDDAERLAERISQAV